MKATNITELNAAVRELFQQHITSLNGLLNQPELPEPYKGNFQKLRDELNSKLSTLAPLEQVPAAGEISNVIRYAEYCIASALEQAKSATDHVRNMASELAKAVVEVNGYKEKIANKDLIDKETHQQLMTGARESAQAALLPTIVDNRKGLIETAGLPPAPDKVLKLADQAEFNSRLGTTKENLTKMEAAGAKYKGRGSKLVESGVWLEGTEFNSHLEIVSDAFTTPAGEATPPAGGGTGRPNLNPAHGAGGAGSGADTAGKFYV